MSFVNDFNFVAAIVAASVASSEFVHMKARNIVMSTGGSPFKNLTRVSNMAV